MRIITYAFYIYMISFILVLIFFVIDYRKKRTLKKRDPISVFIPCYNDGESIKPTIESLFRSYPKELMQVVVVNDKSTDDSFHQLQLLQQEFPFELLDNEVNLGKAATLNTVTELAKHENILILDADTLIETRHIEDMMARMQANEKVAAVSCPYVPHNQGFLPLMQNMEYAMLDLVQGSYNIFWAIVLRGGCLMIKKKPFEEVGKFATRVMTEDVDLAFKLTKAKYKVEQSFYRVETIVPEKAKEWFKQKLRRNSGGAHCSFKYPLIWIRNPLHVLMMVSFNLLILALLVNAVTHFDLLLIIFSQSEIWRAFWVVFNLQRWLDFFINKCSFSIIALPYVLPQIANRKDIRKIIYVVPYAIIYVPMYSFAGMCGWFKGIYHYRRLENLWKVWGRAR